ncbi:hypothetical protein I4U23_027688 [Adineta vaga]|nr:hypothetical protein I4U23_027688 [Adineta vaga]
MTIQLIGSIEIDDSTITRSQDKTILNTIHIQGIHINDSIIEFLINIMKANPRIHTFSLLANQLGVFESDLFANALRYNSNIHTFKLLRDHNNYSEIGKFANAIRDSSSIHTLSLIKRKIEIKKEKTSFNLNVANYDIKRLTEALRNNPNIHTISIDGAFLGYFQAEKLAQIIRNSSNIHTFCLLGDKLQSSQQDKFIDAIRNNSSIHTFSLLGIHLGYIEAKEFADAIRTKDNTDTFNLIENDLGHPEKEKLINSINSNTRILNSNVKQKELSLVAKNPEKKQSKRNQPTPSLLRKSKSMGANVFNLYVSNGVDQTYNYPANNYYWTPYVTPQNNVFNRNFFNVGFNYPYLNRGIYYYQ